MTDLAPAAPDTSPSTQLEPTTSTPNNPVNFQPDAAPEPKVEQAKPLTARQALEKAAAEGNVKTEEPKAAKPAPEVKAEPEKTAPARENGRFVSTRETPQPSGQPEAKGIGQEGEDGSRPSEGRGHEAPPARFLLKAKEEWANTPEYVRREIHRAIQETEKGMEEYRESHEFRKELRQFEDLAKASGVTVKQALDNYTAIDRELKQNPLQGLEKVFKAAGIDPVAYSKHILGQQQQMQANPGMAQTQQLERQVQALTQQLTQLTQGQQKAQQEAQETAQISDIEKNIINPFRTSLGSNDRYEELQADIALFLNSDRISFNLTAQQRLEAAYDMAERINPAPSRPQTERLKPAREKPLNPAGEKSIKGAPGVNDSVGDKGKLKPRDAIRAAAAELGISM